MTGKYQQLELIREQLVCCAGRAGSEGLNEPAGEDNTADALQTWRTTSLQIVAGLLATRGVCKRCDRQGKGMRCNCDGRELLSRLGAGARKRHGLARPLDQPICQCHQQQATHNTKHGGELNLASCQMEDEFRGSDAVFFLQVLMKLFSRGGGGATNKRTS